MSGSSLPQIYTQYNWKKNVSGCNSISTIQESIITFNLNSGYVPLSPGR